MSKLIKPKFDEIQCPKCKTLIPLSEALQHQIQEQIEKESRQKIDAKETEMRLREKQLEEKEKVLDISQKEIDKKVEHGIKIERVKLEKEIQEKAKADVALELQDAKNQLAEKEKKLKNAEKTEFAMKKREQALSEKEKRLDLEIVKKLADERRKIQEEVSQALTKEHRLKDAEKDKKLRDAIKVNDELRRKLQQGSQQTQGEVLELELEELIKTSFISDFVEPVPKGVNGADVIHRVMNKKGDHCGVIVWESKHTKAWTDSWIQKLKDDLRIVKGDIAILVSEVLPKDIKNFGMLNGVWITNPQCALGLATAIRNQLIEVSMTKLATVGKNEKMEVLYRYLSGSEFKQRVEAIVEAFIDMQKDLQVERKTAELRWSKREKQIQKVISNTAGMYGDFQGLIGSSLQSIPALTAGEEEVLKNETVDFNDIPF